MVTSFHPPSRTLMGPGPSDVSPRVLAALGRPTIGHLDPDFIILMDKIKSLLQGAFRTKNELTMPISAPGSAGMETCFVNLLEPGDKAIVCINGVFGGRMKENVERCGATAIVIEDSWGKAVSVSKVAEAFEHHPDVKVLAFVHAETSTGVVSDARELCKLAKEHNALTIVDAVTSLGGIEVDVDAWGADAVYSGSQKCLSCVPGISPVTFSSRATEAISKRKHKVQSWFLDMQLVMDYWSGSKRAYHHTAPVNMLYALHESLVILEEEGLEQSWKRHRKHHNALLQGVEAMGLNMPVDPSERLPQLNLIEIPAGVDDLAVRSALLNQYGLEIGAGLGSFASKAWRIGLMGESCYQENVLLCLSALDNVLAANGSGHQQGAAVKAAMDFYSQ